MSQWIYTPTAVHSWADTVQRDDGLGDGDIVMIRGGLFAASRDDELKKLKKKKK